MFFSNVDNNYASHLFSSLPISRKFHFNNLLAPFEFIFVIIVVIGFIRIKTKVYAGRTHVTKSLRSFSPVETKITE